MQMQRRFPSRNQWLTISWTKTDRGQFHCESIHHFELLSSLCSVKKSSQLFNKVKETLIPLFLYLSSGFFCQPPSNFQPSGGKNLSWGSSNWKEDIKRLYESSQWKNMLKGQAHVLTLLKGFAREWAVTRSENLVRPLTRFLLVFCI